MREIYIMIVFERKRIMSSWANLRVTPLKKMEPTIRCFYSSSNDDYIASTLGFLYSFVFCQRSAEPFYIHDTQGYFQPLLSTSPVLHYLKQSPQSSNNLANDPQQMVPVLNAMSLATLKRTAQPIFAYNGETRARIDTFINNFGLNVKSYDIGIALDISGCIPQVVKSLQQFQKRTGKKSLKVFVMTDQISLLKEFAVKGDSTWSYVSMMRANTPQDKTYRLLKTLSELQLMKQLEVVAVKLDSPLGKLLTLTSETQVLAIDGASWKAL